MKNLFAIIILGYIIIACNPDKQYSDNENIINFGNLSRPKISDICTNYKFVKLETNDSCIIGEINEIQVYNERIYIMDSYLSKGIFVFSMDGKHLATLAAKGDGPGEFLYPNGFQIDKKGYILVLDRHLNRLQRYKLEDFSFVDKMAMPLESPQSFSYLPADELYAFYYGFRNRMGDDKRQLFVATSDGEIRNRFLELGTIGRILYQTPCFYYYDDKIIFHPLVSDKIYELDKDSIYCRYKLIYGKNEIPNQSFFEKYNDQESIINELINGKSDFIRLIFAYENEQAFVVKYYIKKVLYAGIWLKKENKLWHFKYNDIEDDLGIGGKYPTIIGKYKDKFIGSISIADVDEEKIKEPELKVLLETSSEEDNPVLVFHDLK